jgi:RHS repeat-associated protein
MVKRTESGTTYTQNFDTENRITSIVTGSQTTTFVYDGDGVLSKKVKPDGTYTLYIGGIYEVDLSSGGTVTKKTSYYPGGAMRADIVGGSNTLYYLLKDHLGSASVVLDSSGVLIANGEQRYYPYGEKRITTAALPTDRLYTGQLELASLGGIYHYGARFYSPRLGRFLSADSIVPEPTNPQGLNRYSYGYNHPVKYVDPSGHEACYDTGVEIGTGGISQADCWAYGRDKFIRGWDVSTPVAGSGYSTESAVAAIQIDFGYSLEGEWSGDSILAIQRAVYDVAIALNRSLGATGIETFRQVFGEIRFVYDADLAIDGWCITEGYTITCNHSVSARLTVHELGHVFDISAGWNGALDSGNSAHMLETIYDSDGVYVTGPACQGCPYVRTNEGYRSEGFPDQQHPANISGGQQPIEEFADMFTNWIYDSFADNAAGEARYNFMTVNMQHFVNEAIIR